MKKVSRFTLFIAFIFFTLSSKSQLAGSYGVPGTFTSIAAAINSLNVVGVAGPVTINIAAGYTETAPVGGLSLLSITGSSSSNLITFRKNGIGTNPLIMAYAGGTATPFSAIQDGIWKLIGSDYIIIDGIDLVDPNTTNPATMEFGYGFFKGGTAPGCQNNIIKNCVITLNRINAEAGNGDYIGGSKGIYVSSASNVFMTQPVNIGNFTGTHSNNKFYANKIQNCHIGICLHGYNTLGFAPYSDQQNDVGGLSAVTGNTIVNFGGFFSSNFTLEAYGVRAANQYSLNVSFNTINNNDGSGINPVTTLMAIFSSNQYAENLTINSNTISLSSSSTNSLQSLNGIFTGVGTTTVASTAELVNINNNVFPSYTYTSSDISLNNTLIYDDAQSSVSNINNNLFQNVNVGGGYFYMIHCVNASTCSINSNTINAVVANAMIAIHSIESNAFSQNIISNSINNIACNNPTSSIVINLYSGSSVVQLSIANNTLSNCTTRSFYGIQAGGNSSGSNYNVSGNTIFNIGSVPGTPYGSGFTGITVSGSGASALINANNIYSISSTATALNNVNFSGFYGIAVGGVNQATVSGNKLYGFSSSSGGNMVGMNLGAPGADVYNNLIGDFTATGTINILGGLYGILATGGSYRISFNTIYLNNTVNSGPGSNSYALSIGSNTTSFTLKNNILVNTSVATGITVSTVLQTTTLTSAYNAVSNHNLLYAGPPSTNNVIFTKGSTTYSTIAAFKTQVSPREAQSFTETPPFITTNGASSNWLNINPTVLTQIEGGASPIAGINTDYGGNARNATTPDIGAWEGNFLQADYFVPIILSSGFTTIPCNNFTNRTYTMSVKDTSGVATGTLAPRLYYRVNFGTYSSTQGVLSAGTPSNGIWTFNLSYAASLGDVIYYFVAMQDQSAQNNLLVFPPSGASATDVNTIIFPPSPASSYTLQTNPTISVNSGSICSGQNFQIIATGATTYTYSSGSALVSPVTSTVYIVTGSSSGGCPSSNTAVVSITVSATPTITVNSGTVCSGQSFTFTPSGAINYTFTGGSVIVSPVFNTVYTVTGINADGCLSAKVTATIVVNVSLINAQASINTLCRSFPVTLIGGGGLSYTWTGGVTNNVAFYPNVTSNYTVSGISTNGCPGSATLQIIVNPLPTLSLSASAQSICSGENTILFVSGANSYTWEPNGVSAIQTTVTPLVTTNYTVGGTDNNGCTSASVIAVNVDECVGIGMIDANAGISIYPNPARGMITIVSKNQEQPLTLKIYNSLSQLVYNNTLKQDDLIADLSNLPKGVYFVTIYKGEQLLKQQKIIMD